MKKNLIILLAALLIASCKNPKVENNHLSKLFENYYAESLSLYPLNATFNGDTGYNNLLRNDITQEFKSEEKTFYSKYLNLLKNYDLNKLTDKDKISYKLLKWKCEDNLERLKFHYELIPINQIFSLHIRIGQFAGGTSVQPFKTVKDYQDWLLRVDGFIVWCDTAVENMKRGIKQGYVLPKALAEKVIPQLEDLAKGPAVENLFYKPILSFPEGFSQENKEKIKAAYRTKIENDIIPNLQKLEIFFKKEYLPHCRETSGIYALPGGKEYYAFLIKEYTTTNLSADEIFNIGQKEVERITNEMEKVKEQVGYKGDLISFLDFVRNNKQLMPYKTPEEIINHFKVIQKIVEGNIKNLFDVYPHTQLEIRREPAFSEKSAAAHYVQGSLNRSRPGIFYLPIPDSSKYNIFEDEDIFLHEGIPGHHLQISIQNEDTTLPKFQTKLFLSAYGEGWGLYAESLGKDLGLYTDHYQYFGMLNDEMHRSIRLVVDVGIHSKGWTREQAIKYSLEHEAEPEQLIISEVERYMAFPGQALSYKIGQLKIIELRHKAEKELGSKFDIRKFHHKLLESGCIPLTLLEQRINIWIEEEKKI
jgi:uncharacterized protein (DUF885 family)